MIDFKKEHWELLFNSIDEGFCIIEIIFDEQKKPVDYQFLMINASFEKQTGLIDAVGKRMRELAPNHEAHWFEMYGRIALTGEPVRFENRAEQLHRWYDVYAFRFGNPKNFQVAILFNDITERKRAEETIKSLNKELSDKLYQLEDANKKIRESEKIKSEFFANVSHELRTPLSLIYAPVESLLAGKYGTLASGQSQALQIIHNNAVRLLQMVNGLLDFAKFEAGKMKVVREPTDVADLLNSLLNDFESMLGSKKLMLVKEIENCSGDVLMDRYLFERIFFNLLSNAIKFTPEGGTITVKAKSEKNNFEMCVKDTGVGIEEKNRKNLFEKFIQGEGSSTRRFEGTGLGLAMVKEFCELLGGSVSVESELFMGSVFTVRLHAPVTQEKEKDMRSQRGLLLPRYQLLPAAGRDLHIADENLKVLVCEDNHELSSYIVSLLSNFCMIKVAVDGEIGLQLANDWQPDLVLTDVMMPKKDGLELCREIKSTPTLSKITVVLLTAMTHREAMIKGWEARADEYLFKPFHPDELVTRIRSLLSIIVERKKAAEDLEMYTRQLEQANKELESFSYSISHDLRAPLRAILGYISMLKEDFGPALNEEGVRIIGNITANAAKMNKQIEDLLKLASLGKRGISKSSISMTGLAKEVIKEIEQGTKHTAEIIIHDMPLAYADNGLMGHVYHNLVSNAIKYSSKKDKPKIEIGFTTTQKGITYFVKDNGAGFDMKYYEKLFGVFQRLHRSEEFEGTGIGLAIAEKIISKHGGSVWAEGHVNGGAVFYFSLSS